MSRLHCGPVVQWSQAQRPAVHAPPKLQSHSELHAPPPRCTVGGRSGPAARVAAGAVPNSSSVVGIIPPAPHPATPGAVPNNSTSASVAGIIPLRYPTLATYSGDDVYVRSCM